MIRKVNLSFSMIFGLHNYDIIATPLQMEVPIKLVYDAPHMAYQVWHAHHGMPFECPCYLLTRRDVYYLALESLHS